MHEKAVQGKLSLKVKASVGELARTLVKWSIYFLQLFWSHFTLSGFEHASPNFSKRLANCTIVLCSDLYATKNIFTTF
jgi:hypothetical protein